MSMKERFKTTDIGLIPIEWEVHKLANVTERISVGLATSVTKFYRACGTPIIRNLNIKDGFFDPSDMLYLEPAFAKQNASKAARAFDVLTVHTGSNLGLTCVLPADFDGCQTFTTLITTANARVLNPLFLARVMSSNYGKSEMARLQVGGGKGNLNTADLKRFRIAFPPTLAEQEMIAKALSDADAWIESLEQLIAKKRQIKQGAMQELLTGKRRLPGFAGGWDRFRFDQLFSNLRNASNSRSELAVEGDVAYVHYGDIHIHPNPFLNPTELRTFISRAKVRTVPRLQDGDLLLADASEDTSAIGKAVEIVGLGGREAVAGLHTMALRGNKDRVADGFKGYLQFLPEVRSGLVSLATGVSVFGITKTGVKAIEVQIPKPSEQSAIAEMLSSMDDEIRSIESKLAKARQIKQAMMQELLTGRIRLVEPMRSTVAMPEAAHA